MTKAAPLILSPAVAKKLSAVFLVSTAGFASLSAKDQTAVMAQTGGLPIEFVPDFRELNNRRSLRDKLLAGHNVSRELEFNDIELNDEERRVLTLIQPVLEKIGGGATAYPWLPDEDFKSTITFGNNYSTAVIRRNGHYVGLKAAKTIWMRASAFWAGGEKPKSGKAAADGHYTANKTVEITATGVSIGCQTMTRAEVEYIAREKKWEPNIG